MNEFNKKLFILAVSIVVIYNCLLEFPSDDGLRHVGLAFGNLTSWGDVYPFSLFEEFKDYDPWFGYDLTLGLIAGAAKYLPVSLLTLKFLLTKALTLLFPLVFFYLVLKRSDILDEIKDKDTFTLTLIILLALLVWPFLRIMIARPFAFGTFFLVYAVGQKGVARGAISSSVLTFFYPYLSWFYIVPVAFAHFIKGNKKFALGAISFIILFLLMQPSSFWGFQIALFKSDIVRNAIETKIGEFGFTLKHITFLIYLGGFLILYPRFSKDVRRLNCLNLLILIYLLPALKYIRYFFDLILPLLFVSFGKEILHILVEPFRELTSSWKTIIQNGLDNIKSAVRSKPVKPVNTTDTKKATAGRSLKPYIAIAFLLIFALLIHANLKQVSSLKEFQDTLFAVPEGSLVLADFNLQYKILYLRPDLHVIPSCEMGFPRDSIKKEYIEFMNEGEILALARKTRAEFFVEQKRNYINPKNGEFLRLVKKSNDLNIWKVLYSSEIKNTKEAA